MTVLGQGVVLAAAIVVLQLVAAQFLGDVPSGTRGQGVGAALTSLLMLVAGLALGAWHRRIRRPGDGAAGEVEDATSFPVTQPRHGTALATAVVLGLVGLLAYFGGLFDRWMPAAAAAPGGAGHAMFATDAAVLVGVVLVNIGYTLGFYATPGTFRRTIAGFAGFALMAAVFAYAARFVSYEATTVVATAVAGFGLAALATGFAVAWFRRRLAFVELVLIALLVAYALFLTAALGPTEWTEASSLPDEQILLALALFPILGLTALLNVGGSLGFLLNGGGRYDPGYRVEFRIAMRYLSSLKRNIAVVLGFILFLVFELVLIGLNLLTVALGALAVAVGVLLTVLLAYRRHWRQWVVGMVPIIAIFSVCLGVWALIMVLSIMSGFEDDLKKKILGAHAHVVINKRGDDFTEYKAVTETVRKVEGVRTGAAFVLGDAMISTDVNLSGTLVKGVDVSDPASVSDLRKTVTKGFLEHLLTPEEIPGARPTIDFPPAVSPNAGSSTTSSNGVKKAPPYELSKPVVRAPRRNRRILPGIIIGRELARTLRAYVGDTVQLVSPVSDEIGPMGPIPKIRRFRVAGIFYSGMYEYDAKFSYLEMKDAQRFFGVRKRATGVEIKVHNSDDTGRVSDAIRRRLGGHPYVIKDWRTTNKELFSALLLERLAMFIALGMIVIVASFLIIAVLVMVVLQRKKEIAVLKSLGASDASIMKIFVMLGVTLGTGGAIFGGILGVTLCLFLTHVGWKLDERIFYIERLPIVMDWTEISVIVVVAIIISYLATIYPAMTAAAHSPVEGLRDD